MQIAYTQKPVAVLAGRFFLPSSFSASEQVNGGWKRVLPALALQKVF
jgi:hypothetical protein